VGTAALEMLPAESLAPPAPGEDRRITRSKRALRGALIALIEERGLDAITVNDLCERADLNRGTFYNHFHDKENLLTALENEVLAEVALLQARMQSVTLGDMLAFRVAGRPVPVLVDLFEYLRGESDFLRAVLGSGGDVRFGPRLREAVCENLVQNILHEKYRTNPTPFVCYYVAFYASAYLGIIARWVENGCPETPEEMARIAMRLLFITPGEPIEL
jgi:AcrR family transcriptional regulator